jgi:hypothetical protein
MRKYGKLTEGQKSSLQRIDPSRDGSILYYPCLVTTSSGRKLDRVYVVEDSSYIRAWGVWPEDDKHKSWVKIEEVRSISESPSRLPAALVTEIYRQGETRMGGYEFTIVFEDGYEVSFEAGNALDFIEYPDGLSQTDVISLRLGARGEPRRTPPYFWCLYSAG